MVKLSGFPIFKLLYFYIYMNINSPEFNDNRNYDYSVCENEERNEYNYISGLIRPNSKVIDLGCGNGSLLYKLIREKNVEAAGIELSKSGVSVCKKKGLNVVEGRIDEALPFEDNQFDYSICNVTIQMVRYPEILLSEMKRISKNLIISFPNFAFYKNRIDLLLKGRMPVPMLFGYSWYSTGHIHQLSVKDFWSLVNAVGELELKSSYFESSGNTLKDFFIKRFPNLFQVLIIYQLTHTGNSTNYVTNK